MAANRFRARLFILAGGFGALAFVVAQRVQPLLFVLAHGVGALLAGALEFVREGLFLLLEIPGCAPHAVGATALLPRSARRQNCAVVRLAFRAAVGGRLRGPCPALGPRRLPAPAAVRPGPRQIVSDRRRQSSVGSPPHQLHPNSLQSLAPSRAAVISISRNRSAPGMPAWIA